MKASTFFVLLVLMVCCSIILATNFNQIPGNTDVSTLWVPPPRTLTINGVAQDLTANRSWTVTVATPTPSATATPTPTVPPLQFYGTNSLGALVFGGISVTSSAGIYVPTALAPGNGITIGKSNDQLTVRSIILGTISNLGISSIGARQFANGYTPLMLQRFTDTAPTGDFISAFDVAGGSPNKLFNVDINGNITVGTWQGSVIGSAYLPTGIVYASATPIAGQLAVFMDATHITGATPTPTATPSATATPTATPTPTDTPPHGAQLTVDGGGTVVAAGVSGATIIQHTFTISKYKIICEPVACAVTADVVRAANGAGLPSVSIVGTGTKPVVSSGEESAILAPVGWTSVVLTEGDKIALDLSGISNATRVQLVLYTP